MAKVQVGGKDYNVKPLTFDTLEKVWPFIEEIQTIVEKANGDPMAIKSPVTIMKPAVAAIALMIAQDDPELQAIYDHPEHNGLSDAEKDQIVIKKVARTITSVEGLGLEEKINEVMKEAGFEAAQPGENKASPSTATGTDSSQSSSPLAAKEEAGTE